jgi:hypothetical protein
MALMAHWHSTPALDEVAQKWRALAERRRAHFVELYHTGRWKRYYSEEQFLLKMREAIKATNSLGGDRAHAPASRRKRAEPRPGRDAPALGGLIADHARYRRV